MNNPKDALRGVIELRQKLFEEDLRKAKEKEAEIQRRMTEEANRLREEREGRSS